jgi:hypothetical protein
VPSCSPTLMNTQSALVIGTANTGFDVLEDCWNAGIRTTVVARSPTYLYPWTYCLEPSGLGMYDSMPATFVDEALLATPIAVAGPMLAKSYEAQAAKEPCVSPFFILSSPGLAQTDQTSMIGTATKPSATPASPSSTASTPRAAAT